MPVMVKPEGFRIRLFGHVRSLIKGVVGGVKTPSRIPPPRPPPRGRPKDVVRNVVMIKLQGFRIRLVCHVIILSRES